jgi:hypothetical protein
VEQARLIIDASADKRLATELLERGRPAAALSSLGLQHSLDEDLLPALADQFANEPWVLVTADDAMPAEHGGVIARLGATIATIDPAMPTSYATQAHWNRDVVHRWAHAMAEQRRGTIRRYSVRRSNPWTFRPRRMRRR